jgi:hypothetical protein
LEKQLVERNVDNSCNFVKDSDEITQKQESGGMEHRGKAKGAGRKADGIFVGGLRLELLGNKRINQK